MVVGKYAGVEGLDALDAVLAAGAKERCVAGSDWCVGLMMTEVSEENSGLDLADGEQAPLQGRGLACIGTLNELR